MKSKGDDPWTCFHLAKQIILTLSMFIVSACSQNVGLGHGLCTILPNLIFLELSFWCPGTARGVQTPNF